MFVGNKMSRDTEVFRRQIALQVAEKPVVLPIIIAAGPAGVTTEEILARARREQGIELGWLSVRALLSRLEAEGSVRRLQDGRWCTRDARPTAVMAILITPWAGVSAILDSVSYSLSMAASIVS
jgi:predicted transcriptional regulator of viral defense system